MARHRSATERRTSMGTVKIVRHDAEGNSVKITVPAALRDRDNFPAGPGNEVEVIEVVDGDDTRLEIIPRNDR